MEIDGKRQEALKLVSEMLSPEISASIAGANQSTEFGGYIGELALQNVFSSLWTRPGLDRRSRSLVTLGILIALHAGNELSIHVMIALKNGLTVAELEEVIYHASGYAGFPAASQARTTALAALRAAGIVE